MGGLNKGNLIHGEADACLLCFVWAYSATAILSVLDSFCGLHFACRAYVAMG